MSKAERAAMPPDVKRAVEMVRIWMVFVGVGMVGGWAFGFSFDWRCECVICLF